LKFWKRNNPSGKIYKLLLVWATMETINVEKSDFNKILNTMEILLDDFEKVLSQDEIVNQRIEEIETGKVKGKTEEDYQKYLKKRIFG
jgi:hypothetical protein